MSNARNRTEEQALDALLMETLGKVEPPDLTERILSRLASDETGEELRPIVSATSSRAKLAVGGTATREDSPRKRLVLAASILAAVAASILLIVWTRFDGAGEDGEAMIAGQPSSTDPPSESLAVDDQPGEPRLPTTPPSVPRGIPLVVEQPTTTHDEVDLADRVEEPAVVAPLPDVILVSKQFDEQFQSYWSKIGVEPAEEAAAEEVVARLRAILGVDLPPELLADPERLQAEFSDQQVAREIAARWLQQITDRGLQRLDPTVREELIAELASCIQGDRPLDRTLADWINGQSPRSSAFYAAVTHSGRDAMARRLAAVTMNVDLRCLRCHDSKIEGSGRQQDYWGFSALLNRGVVLDREGGLTIDPSPDKQRPLFYELADGRQRLAEPYVSSSWLDLEDQPRVETIKAWADQLIGSEAMARGAVNSLWQLVHGQPLQGRVVDPITAPHDEELDRIQDELVGDMVDSRFDVARTLALIVASPATRRSVPSPLRPENALVALPSEKQQALEAVNAFAAALPRHTDLPLAQRLDQAMRAIGGTLDQNGRPFVAQIGDPGEKRSEPNSGNASKPLADDFPVRDETLPVQWLTLIQDEQSRLSHLGYLAGLQRLPENVQAAVEAMQEDDQMSDSLLLNRVWWLIRP
jgi:hypothetical protein